MADANMEEHYTRFQAALLRLGIAQLAVAPLYGVRYKMAVSVPPDTPFLEDAAYEYLAARVPGPVIYISSVTRTNADAGADLRYLDFEVICPAATVPPRIL
jgi:hypothetical protein